MNKKVVLVGAGICNIMTALRLANSSDLQVHIYECGRDIDKRKCPKAKTGKCVNCNPCQITTGFGGAGFFSDCKLTYSPDVGGDFIKLVGQEKFNSLLKQVDSILDEFGGSSKVYYNQEFVSYDCSKYGLKLVKGDVRHLGTDKSYEVMTKMYQALQDSPNIYIHCNKEISSIDFENKLVYIPERVNTTEGYKIISSPEKYDYLSIAVGRYGSDWLRSLCIKNNIPLEDNEVDVGVRVECPRAITDFITDNLYEFKIIGHSCSGNKFRTFCVNPGGYVVQENYDDDIACVNGHSLSDNKSMNTNFAILVSSKFTEPFNEPIKYGKSICRMTNMLAGGKVMAQRWVDLVNGNRSTWGRMSKLAIEPSLQTIEPGDIRYALPSRIVDSIIEAIKTLNNVIPGLDGRDTILYAPEIKFYSSKIKLDSKLQSKYDNVYFGGDSSGTTHGIIQSAMEGIYIGEEIEDNNV